ncbi:MAG TPA: DNA repair protein RadC [Streptosporangiaceae bacterium]|jgi:DNA repair protein RadC|nr:DNA repair protein RadC [Streptosporangiaceae bacterium]
MLMSQVPATDRPRERLAERGTDALGDRELLALLISTGVRGKGAHEVAEGLLDRFGSITAIGRATVAELSAVAGIGTAKASSLVASFELARRSERTARPRRLRATTDIAAVARSLLSHHERERLIVISCDAGLRVLGTDRLSDGAADQTLFPLREIIVAVLRRDGLSFALAHNHPSGDTTPTPEDVSATQAVVDAAALTGLGFLDHVIVTENAWEAVPVSR